MPHCESEAYVWALAQPDGTMTFHFARRKPVRRLRESPPSQRSSNGPSQVFDRVDIAEVTPDIVEQIFRQNISMGKGMGLMSMVEAVRALAKRQVREQH